MRGGLHWVRRARDVFYREGAASVATKLIARLRLMAGIPDTDQRAFLARKAVVDLAFDGDLGTDTGGIQTVPSLTVRGKNAHFGVDHIASDPDEFTRAIEALDIAFASATFLDLGAGKGRALLLAARYPFKHIVGVEFAEELYATAVENIVRAGADPRISIFHGDATDVEFPDGPLVIFMFNPFDAPVVQRVATNALASFRVEPRPMRILYLNPRCADAVTGVGWNTVATGTGFMMFAPPN